LSTSGDGPDDCQPPNQALHLTGAAIRVFWSSTLLEAAPAGELGR